MTSKEATLESIRRNRPKAADLPGLHDAWTTYSDPRAKFIEVLEAVGGKVFVSRDSSELNEQLQRLPHYLAAKRVASLVPGVATLDCDLAAIKSPHDLATLDVAVFPGEFGVAENAAVWVTDRGVSPRVAYFLCQHLVLVVPEDAIVNNMHEAYDRISAAPALRAPSELSDSGRFPPFAEPVFGAFISGPSKTADIEQTLVVGAHGARSLTVCLLQK